MNFFYTIFFFFTSILFSSTLDNLSHKFTEIEQDEVHFLNSLYQERLKQANSIAKPPIKLLKQVQVENKILEQEQKYLQVKQEFKHLEEARAKRKAFLQEWTKSTKIRKPYSKKVRKNKGHITVKVRLSKQHMKVYKDKKLLYTWKVSTARKGHKTPKGTFKAQIIEKMHYSSLYNNAPMPYTIFYDGDYAIHGTKETRKLGRPASHGCVRLHTKNAKKLYKLAGKYGKENVFIQIVR